MADRNDPSRIEIHPAQPRDYDMLAQMCRENLRHQAAMGGVPQPDGEERLAQIRSCIGNPEWLVLVAYYENAPAGYATARLLKSGEHAGRGQLTDLFIAREHRRHGIGAALVKRVEERLAQMGAEGFAAEVDVRNVTALGFFAGKGYAWARRYDGPVGAYQGAVEDAEMTTGEVSKFFRMVPKEQLPDKFMMLKGGPSISPGLKKPFVRISLVEGDCACGRNTGREWLASGSTPAGICGAAYYAMYPYLNGLLNGAKFPVTESDGGIILRCPYGGRERGAIYRLQLEK